MSAEQQTRSTRPRRFFSEDEQRTLLAAIAAAERKTSGEIRVHLESKVPRRRPYGGDPYRRARRLFARLGMHATAERNGVLFYLATKSRRLAIVGDEKLHEKVGEGFWREIASSVGEDFQAGRYAEGLAEAIGRVGERLREHFPYRDDDVNELPDEISY